MSLCFLLLHEYNFQVHNMQTEINTECKLVKSSDELDIAMEISRSKFWTSNFDLNNQISNGS